MRPIWRLGASYNVTKLIYCSQFSLKEYDYRYVESPSTICDLIIPAPSRASAAYVNDSYTPQGFAKRHIAVYREFSFMVADHNSRCSDIVDERKYYRRRGARRRTSLDHDLPAVA